MRRSKNPFRYFPLRLLCALTLLAGTLHAAIVYAPPENSPDAAAELKVIDRELSDRNVPAAAKRLDTLLAARTEQLAILSENSLTSIIAWLNQLPPPQRTALASEYAKTNATPARQSLDSLQKNRTPSIDELYALARRYPMTPAAAAALTQAADRSLQLGDFPAAQVFYELALQENASLGESRAHNLATIKKINTGERIPAPVDLDLRAAMQSDNHQPADRLPIVGPLPFDAPWYNTSANLGQAKFFPYTSDDRIILSSWKGVAMLRENGEVLWTSVNPTPPGAFPVDRAAAVGRGALFAPAVLADLHSRPAIIVVRQPTPQGDSQFILRALRAADGKTLWSTPPGDWRNEFSYIGLPAISGRYVYTMAVNKTGVSGGNLQLCALDITTGQSLWQATLGTISEQGDLRGGGKFVRGEPLNLESFAELSEPAISSDLVLLSPNCGALIAVGRFDGRIRWVYSYRQAENAPAIKAGRASNTGEVERSLKHRYRSTPVVCADSVLTMPQDAPQLIAVERATGKFQWETTLYGGIALAGASGNTAILCGDSLAGVNALKERLVWKYDPPRGTTITGPATVAGQTVIAPTTTGFIQLSASDGKEKPAYSIPNLRHLLTFDTTKATLNEIGIGKSFGPSGR